MDKTGKYFVTKRVIAYEVIAFVCITIIIWLDEIIDIPHLLFRAEPTPLNWIESLFESIIIIFIGALIVYFTNKIFRRIKYLEKILPICAYCKRIRKPDSDPEKMDSWEKIEVYISNKTASQFSHSICPECMKKVYKDIPNMLDKGKKDV